MTYYLNLAGTFKCAFVGFCKKYCEIIPEHGVTGTVGMRVDVYMWRLQ